MYVRPPVYAHPGPRASIFFAHSSSARVPFYTPPEQACHRPDRKQAMRFHLATATHLLLAEGSVPRLPILRSARPAAFVKGTLLKKGLSGNPHHPEPA